jgi:hypothetical protein
MGFLAGFEFGRTYLLVPFFACVSCVAALETLRTRPHPSRQDAIDPRRRWHPAPWAVLCTIIVAVTLWQSASVKQRTIQEMSGGSSFLLFQDPDLMRLAHTRSSSEPFRIATLGWHPSYAWAYGLETADGYLQMYSKRYQEFWEQVIAVRLNGDDWLFDYFHNWGNRIYLFSPATADGVMKIGSQYDLELLSLANVRYVASTIRLQDPDLELRPTASRHSGDRSQDNPLMPGLASVLNIEEAVPAVYVYENHQALPRFFVAGRARTFDSSRELLAALANANVADLRSNAFLLRSDAADLPPIEGSGTVDVSQYSADRIALDVEVDGSAMLVASNNYSPFWKARVNGRDVALRPVDHTFQGVHVSGGRHAVVLYYDPPYAAHASSLLAWSR